MKKAKKILLVITLGLLLSSCSAPAITLPSFNGGTIADAKNVVEANNQFALDLYSRYKASSGNIFFSPYSISTALAMTYEGARGQTAIEMQKVFHFPKDSEKMRAGYANIINQINKPGQEYQLQTANALWAQESSKFLDEYFSLIKKYYGGEVTNLDFINKTENSRKTINSWVEDQTNNKIKNLIPSGAIDGLTRLVLTNAIYFKGEWLKQFDENKTREQTFRINEDNEVEVPMMQRTDKEAEFNYGENEELQILELPYTGEELSMLIFLPKNNDLKTLEDSLSLKELAKWKKDLAKQRVKVYLPKFKFETKYSMAKDLAGMGMPTAFSMTADLSGMDGTKNLFISAVIHQAFVEVNEEGTEAAAATAVAVSFKGMSTNEPVIPVFRADHPFIFIIQQNDTGNILFLGRVSDPR